MKRKKRTDPTIAALIGIFIFILFIVAVYVVDDIREKNLKAHIAFSNAIITKCLTSGNGMSGIFEYRYSVGNRNYIKSRSDNDAHRVVDGPENFIGKYFPMVYNSNNPDNSDLLLTPSDFYKYDLNFPDSLVWIKKYVRRYE